MSSKNGHICLYPWSRHIETRQSFAVPCCRTSWPDDPGSVLKLKELEFFQLIKKGKTKIQVVNELGISYYRVKKHTQDIPTILMIPKQLQQSIREEIKKGRSIHQTSKKLHVSRDTIIKYTRDIPKHWIKPGRSPELKKEIRKNVIKYNSDQKLQK